MFYGGGRDEGGRGGGGNRNRSDRYEQMTKQQQLIEFKKQEIQRRLEEEKHKRTIEALLTETKSSLTALGSSSSSASSPSAPTPSRQNSTQPVKSEEDSKANAFAATFANDGSFLEKFKKLQEEKKKEKVAEVKAPKEEINEYGEGSPSRPPLPPSLKVLDASKVSQNTDTKHDIANPAIGSHGNHNHGVTKGNTNYPPPNFYGNVAPPPPPPPPPRPAISKAPEHVRPSYSGFGYQNAPPPPPPPPPPPRPSHSSPQSNRPHFQQQTPHPSINHQKPSGFPSEKVKQLAADVAEGGDRVEEMARIKNKDDPIFWFLFRPDSAEYGRYRDLVTHLKFENMPTAGPTRPFYPVDTAPPPPPPPPYQQPIKRSMEEEEDLNRKRRSRWGPQSGAAVPPPSVASFGPNPGGPGHFSPRMMTGAIPPAPPHVQVTYPIGGIKQETGMDPSAKNFGMGLGGGMHQMPPGMMNLASNVNINVKGPPPMLTRVTRTNPQLLSYARQSYGTVDLDDEQWKQCEEAYKMNLLFQDIARKKAKDEQMAMAGKFKHEYDSDEEVDDGGTWEHKQRMKEMEKTKDWAHELTNKAKGKHHIGDFLPPEELEKFMDKYKAVKEGRQMDESAYQDFKIAQDNVGFKLLQKMGWNDGQGLGSAGQGITAPIDKAPAITDKQGLGVEKPSELSEEDDEYAAYRKRMMLAYRFRPNPLNNPRRAYY